ncbi:3-oxo-tetronate kinase [Photobacterium rosenbergii]|uniref:3-oxo-tetronate kinase n=1 Tax=Photobacterium rosenbergii TaxID=294936 RepID=UPI001C99EC01|nr:3-oxo-tetronate kinase [Photobacterium rosenbergii]MBY5944673.1 four-carbon acid sugar kinase family protein [Photobacterium rosenbergii]
MKIGVIADDFTGATDAAGFIVKSGLRVIQLSGAGQNSNTIDADALVVSLKTRSCPPQEAIEQSLAACDWLLEQGCTLIYFKYCSTFDSTAEGNIGPVTEALMKRLEVSSTLVCPALPVNGRTVYQGNLFVFHQPLSESGMKHHPITPMTDSNLLRLIEAQTHGKAGLLNWQTINKGVDSTHVVLHQLVTNGTQFVVCDTLCDENLEVLGEIAQHHRLVTGGSGLVGAIAKAITHTKRLTTDRQQETLAPTKVVNGVVISGSCSEMTNRQVAAYKAKAPSYKIAIDRCLNEPDYIDEVVKWVIINVNTEHLPMVYATAPADELHQIQQQYGQAASIKIEALFHQLVQQLYTLGFNTFISAGGETSGTITQALSVDCFKVGPEIVPGVPWVFSLDGEIQLALKSGNFGNEDFFLRAQEFLQ